MAMLSPRELPGLTMAQREETHAVLSSMFITYPPVFRLELYLQEQMRGRVSIYGDSVVVLHDSGLTCMDLSDRLRTREYQRAALLWPEKA